MCAASPGWRKSLNEGAPATRGAGSSTCDYAPPLGLFAFGGRLDGASCQASLVRGIRGRALDCWCLVNCPRLVQSKNRRVAPSNRLSWGVRKARAAELGRPGKRLMGLIQTYQLFPFLSFGLLCLERKQYGAAPSVRGEGGCCPDSGSFPFSGMIYG